MKHDTFIPATSKLPEITLKGFILGIVLAALMAISNTYLALKIGVLTPSSIPAAIISMGILRLFTRSNILENNQVQTCASAGEAIAGGVVYTLPALVIIHYWFHFDYFLTFAVAIIGGLLGVLFTIPLRRVFMQEPHLNFPEAKAITEVLKMGAQKTTGFAHLLIGSAIGAVMEVAQNGIRVMSSSVSFWLNRGTTVFGFGAGFSATLIGAGYLMGFDVGASIMMGALLASVICLPVLSHVYGPLLHLHHASPRAIEQTIMGDKVRYIGIGAMLVAGVWTLLTLLKPFYQSLMVSVRGLAGGHDDAGQVPRTERDMPGSVLLIGIAVLLVLSYYLFQHIFPLASLGLSSYLRPVFLLTSLIYVLILGFIFSAICGYFSGLVGVTASPGSSVAIAAVLIAALIVRAVITATGHVSAHDLQLGAAITIVLASIVMGAACVANNNSQDLKVGYDIGATPWKQQLMLMTGGVVAALVIPLVMQLLFQVYGIAGAVPHAGMSVSQTLPAPPAAAMGAVAQGVFTQNLPWGMMATGAFIAIACIVLRYLLPKRIVNLSVIGVAIGIYLPLSSSTPLFLGALLSLMVKKAISRERLEATAAKKRYRGIVLACGLVAGASIMNVILAIPLAFMHNPNALSLMPVHLNALAGGIGFVVTGLLCVYFYRSVVKA